jgi:hypothetical protein
VPALADTPRHAHCESSRGAGCVLLGACVAVSSAFAGLCRASRGCTGAFIVYWRFQYSRLVDGAVGASSRVVNCADSLKDLCVAQVQGLIIEAIAAGFYITYQRRCCRHPGLALNSPDRGLQTCSLLSVLLRSFHTADTAHAGSTHGERAKAAGRDRGEWRLAWPARRAEEGCCCRH